MARLINLYRKICKVCALWESGKTLMVANKCGLNLFQKLFYKYDCGVQEVGTHKHGTVCYNLICHTCNVIQRV